MYMHANARALHAIFALLLSKGESRKKPWSRYWADRILLPFNPLPITNKAIAERKETTRTKNNITNIVKILQLRRARRAFFC